MRDSIDDDAEVREGLDAPDREVEERMDRLELANDDDEGEEDDMRRDRRAGRIGVEGLEVDARSIRARGAMRGIVL
jgi:hypothetical protein